MCARQMRPRRAMQRQLFCRDTAVTPMPPAALAALFAAAFPQSRAWSKTEFQDMLAQPAAFLVTSEDQGFAIGRVILDEAELITLAVSTKARRSGVGTALLAQFETTAKTRGATRGFLEVAADNSAALALYQTHEWRESARRRGYYKRANGPNCDALILEKCLT